jgi:hypothetical protein
VHGITSLALANPKRFTPEMVEQSIRQAMKMTLDGLRQR